MSRLLVHAFVCVLCLLGGLHAQPSPSWPQFRGNLLLTGVAAEALKAPLKVQWTYEAGESIESSAAIANGTVFVGSQPGVLVALDLASGKPKWQYKVSESGLAESSPAVARDAVFVGDLEGVLHAVGIADGKPRWTFKTGAEIKSSPIVAGDRVLIGSYDAHLYCLTLDGKLVWKVETKAQVHATPAIRNGVAYVAGCDEILRAPELGRPRAVHDVIRILHGRLPRHRRKPRLLRHVRERGAGRRSRRAQVSVAVPASRSEFPVLRVGGRG